MGVLQHQSEGAAQVILFDAADFNAVETDAALLHLIKAVDQVCDRGFSRSGGADKREFFPGVRTQRKIAEHGLFRVVAEHHVFKLYPALQPAQRSARMGGGNLPGPQAAVLFAFAQGAVGVLLRMRQRDAAFVDFRRFIDQRKDALGPGQRVEHRAKLLRHLRQRGGEAAGELQKQHHGAERENIADSQYAAQNSGESVLQTGQIGHDGQQNIGKCVGPVGGFAQGFVDAPEFFARGLLMTEYLDYALPLDHFFNIAVERAERGLLLLKGVPAPSANHADDVHHHRQQEDGKKRQLPAVPEHEHKNSSNGEKGRKKAGHTAVDHIAQCVGVVGKAAHQLTVRFGIEIAQGEVLHFCKQFCADFVERCGGNFEHQVAVQIRPKRACHEQREHGKRQTQKFVHQRAVVLPNQRGQAVVDNGFQQGAAGNLCA